MSQTSPRTERRSIDEWKEWSDDIWYCSSSTFNDSTHKTVLKLSKSCS